MPFSLKNSSGTILTHSWEDKGGSYLSQGYCLKVDMIAQLEYELAYYDSAVHRFNHYTPGYPTLRFRQCPGIKLTTSR